MKRNAMSFKAVINNIAKENKISAQSVLQTYMLERLLERISVSSYKDKVILKGGMLISAILGIDTRTTMDMDTTIKGVRITETSVQKMVQEICNINLNDGITLKLTKVEDIRKNDEYGGFKVTIKAEYDNELDVTLKIDISTGDKITYREIKYSFTLMFEERKIEIWAYNVETIIAEKFESIISRGALGTRIRDFYDVHMLLKTQRKNIHNKTLKNAIMSTAKHRGTLDVIQDWNSITNMLRTNTKMIAQWKKYKSNNFYAEGIEFEDLIDSIQAVGEVFTL
ncbi:MAG: nucleotidyl transferase AbiEii/AbiGii toxin family protein [Clostridiales bacterium]|nr:nucleotidyl transferase AbiEii/AbiGii toxin family protein [Clostridiales bacterium]